MVGWDISKTQLGGCYVALSKLYYVYGIDTACFYTDEENELEKQLVRARYLRNKIKNKYKNCSKARKSCKNQTFKFLNNFIKDTKEELKNKIQDNENIVRTVRNDKILDIDGKPQLKKRVSIFDSTLTRCFNLKEREFNTEIIIVQVYFTDIAKSIVKNGFYMNGYKYKFFSASAGQIRTKKLVAVREDLLNENWNTLTAGLTIDDINARGGMNINKFLAYLALCNSATDLWRDFDIDRCIVVDDFENTINGTVDFIDDTTYEITRITKELEFTQTDGCGMILPCLTDKNFMVRIPWVKGLLARFDFVRFIHENNVNGIVKDIYGVKHNIIEENIQIIFTKSQFKMWKFFPSWNTYKEKYKQFNCTAGKCNEEEDIFSDSVINYQMIQTLSDLTDDEIKQLAYENDKDIQNLASDVKTMQKVFGATPWNTDKNGFQKCLERYPELLSDTYCRQTLKDLKNKLERDLWSARFEINGKYTFVIPDLYAFCEWLFLQDKQPQGLLQDGEVCCKLFGNDVKLDCLRSPHLYVEHPIRVNKIFNDWFDTNAVYISCHDLISRIVQCDYDGDRLLVTDNQTLINAAERNNRDKNIVPLFYNMRKANAEILTPDSLFKGLLLAYNGGNIGEPSNNITKMWNSGDIKNETLHIVKWLVMDVNYTIDYAKTLYKPTRPKEVNDTIVEYTKAKVPYFFMFAKNKKEDVVNSISNCPIDRIVNLFPKRKLNFNFKFNNIGKFDYRVLMNNPDTEFHQDIADKFKEVTSKLPFNHVSDKKMFNYLAVYQNAKFEILSLNYSQEEIIDSIILDLFVYRKTPMKKAFWTLFGDEVYDNVKRNIDDNFVQCEKCHKRFYKHSALEKYCNKCKGYKKKKTKIVVCIDCGNEFKTSSLANKKKRCDSCQKEYIRKYDKERKSKI